MGFELTPASLKKLCRELKLYSSCLELNEVLHLHQKGIRQIKCLEPFTGLRTLYLECNAISTIEGLDALVGLRCLYLNQNLIRSISGLEALQALEVLDLSDNQIKSTDNLACLPHLRQLNIAGNYIQTEEDVSHLTSCASLESLDISKNRIDNEGALQVIRQLPLSLLRLAGNPIVSSTEHYRKATLAAMPTLKYLDDSPAFEKEKRLAHAWLSGGHEAENAMRVAIKDEEAATRERHRLAFDDMVANAKAKAAVQRQQEALASDICPPVVAHITASALASAAALLQEPSRPISLASSQEVSPSPAADGDPAGSGDVAAAIEDQPVNLLSTASLEGEQQKSAVRVEEAEGVPGTESEVLSSEGESEDGLRPFAEELAACIACEEEFKRELRERALARAAARVERKSSGDQPEEEGGVAKPRPVIWGTAKYKALWDDAMAVGEQQEAAAKNDVDGGTSADVSKDEEMASAVPEPPSDQERREAVRAAISDMSAEVEAIDCDPPEYALAKEIGLVTELGVGHIDRPQDEAVTELNSLPGIEVLGVQAVMPVTTEEVVAEVSKMHRYVKENCLSDQESIGSGSWVMDADTDSEGEMPELADTQLEVVIPLQEEVDDVYEGEGTGVFLSEASASDVFGEGDRMQVVTMDSSEAALEPAVLRPRDVNSPRGKVSQGKGKEAAPGLLKSPRLKVPTSPKSPRSMEPTSPKSPRLRSPLAGAVDLDAMD